jgi:hypothetical protein
MDRTSAISDPQDKATVSSRVGGVVLDDFAMLNDDPYFHSTDHPVWPQHLLQRMGKEEDSL